MRNDTARHDGFLVLIVEDEPLVAMDLSRLLANQGCRVMGPARSVEEAMRFLNKVLPDLAVLDIKLDGELVTPIAELMQRKNVPFVLASAHDGRAFPEAKMLGKVPNLGKPTDPRQLIALLNEVRGFMRPLGAAPIRTV